MNLAGTIQLDRLRLLDLLSQIPRRSIVTGLVPARAPLPPRLIQASAPQCLSSQRNRPGLAMSREPWQTMTRISPRFPTTEIMLAVTFFAMSRATGFFTRPCCCSMAGRLGNWGRHPHRRW